MNEGRHQAPPIVVVRGTGSIGMRHLDVLKTRMGIDVVAWPMRAERRTELRELGYEVLDEDSLSDTLSLRSIVASDTKAHIPDAVSLLPYGDVLIEKPLAVDRTELPKLVAVAQRHGKSVFVGFCLRFDPG